MFDHCPTNDAELDDLLATPSVALIDCMRRLDGDLAILGIAGKMGRSLGEAAMRASAAAGVRRTIYGVSRFSTPGDRQAIAATGILPVTCDLLDPAAVAKLPAAKHVVFMAGRKFGTDGREGLTWAMNTIAPANVARHYAGSRIVAFSTGCVYPLVSPSQGGCRENEPPAPVGEYAQSCLGRERIFSHYSELNGTPTCLLRLNYAVDLRYGVVHDLALSILAGEPVDLSVGAVNLIWQGDANCQALLALEQATSPATVLNLTGPETLSLRHLALDLAAALDKPVAFIETGEPRGYLNNSAKATALFGYPRLPPAKLVEWTARWLRAGGRSLHKPTHFQINSGKY